jgi:hypothetical protein
MTIPFLISGAASDFGSAAMKFCAFFRKTYDENLVFFGDLCYNTALECAFFRLLGLNEKIFMICV